MSPPLTEHSAAGNCTIVDVPVGAVPLDMAELLRALGYRDAKPPAGMAELVSSTAEEIHDLCEFRAGYRLLPLEVDSSKNHGVRLGNHHFETGGIISRQLKGADQAALMVCTIGPEPETRAAQWLKDREPALGFIADTAASVLAEQTAETVHRHLENKFAAQGLGVTNRFSPGYCGWNVQEQHDLFRLLPEAFCGIRLQDSAFMQPRKSISAIIGIGKGLQRADYACAVCTDDRCAYRKQKQL
ncbi:MAG: hypothetical protein JXR23_10275 [Pontiellaceae bacterium]|nr:hypothetical protein [Pontiellaceae bacterium]